MEAALLSANTLFLHFGMITVGLPYTFEDQAAVDAVNGGSPYGASTIAGSDNRRLPTEIEIKDAEFLGNHVAEIPKKLRG